MRKASKASKVVSPGDCYTVYKEGAVRHSTLVLSFSFTTRPVLVSDSTAAGS